MEKKGEGTSGYTACTIGNGDAEILVAYGKSRFFTQVECFVWLAGNSRAKRILLVESRNIRTLVFLEPKCRSQSGKSAGSDSKGATGTTADRPADPGEHPTERL